MIRVNVIDDVILYDGRKSAAIIIILDLIA